ncbi:MULTISPECIES: glycoside hydrolase family 108 protein [unclassified Ruegeria]|uniref:glycoside hydrolase family 108 protein n=1 Tax=unclassified Ruegeria TaxID=2625375 RepID=UPI0014884AC3|nr:MULTISPECIES: glycoside hydrolase family 108 protein [unclassified Ruegeria]NOD35289.1 hypothetical protein [Ruegeria sp. HKCCD7296]NOD69585.1 hypothetical protein [Ruegeria sp. HKCCD7303]NOE42947.1 hypothetical protein [Ruegeria sp. HKCCD7319]
MSPLIVLASNILPEILKSVLSAKHRQSVDTVSDAVISAVKETTKKEDPEEVADILAKDPQIAADLRMKLAEIAAKEEAEQRAFELAQLEKNQTHALSVMQAKLDANKEDQQQQFNVFKEEIADTQDARGRFAQLAETGSKLAWAQPIISIVIILGFFVVLGLLLMGKNLPAFSSGPDNPFGERLFQIINIVIGALTAAFATVVSFWLGSSQGSKQKDINNFKAQAQQFEAEEQRTRMLVNTVKSNQPAAVPTVIAPQEEKKFANENNFPRCVDIILSKEGGYVDDPDDPGGATNMGITFDTLKSWRKAPITKKDVKDLSVEEAKQIYRANYWNALSCDDLPAGVDLVAFDFGVNAGTSRSGKLLQRIVGVAQDGQVGPITLAAVKAVDPAHIIRRFSELRLNYYQSLPHFPKFGKGWTNRTNSIEADALKFLNV